MYGCNQQPCRFLRGALLSRHQQERPSQVSRLSCSGNPQGSQTDMLSPSHPTGPQKSDPKHFEPRNRACCLAGWPSPSSLCVDGETNQNWKPENHNCGSWKLFSLPKSRPRSLRRFLTRSCVKENLNQKTWMYLPNINPFAPTCSCCSNCPALASSKVLLEDLGDRFSRWLKGKHHFTTRH